MLKTLEREKERKREKKRERERKREKERKRESEKERYYRYLNFRTKFWQLSHPSPIILQYNKPKNKNIQ